MVDTCVSCGEIVPEGELVCPTCFNGGIRCPECGNRLNIMHNTTRISDNKLSLIALYNCTDCGSDWERESSYIGQPVKFTRKIWG